MKKNSFLLTLIIALLGFCYANAKNIQITKFERNYTSLIASMNPVFDNAGDACAVIRFWYSGSDYIIEPNLGIVKIEYHPGETRLWVPQGTKRLTIRHKNDKPLRGYSIPISIESKIDYDADITLTDELTIQSGNHVYLGAGFNIMSLSGPSVVLGGNFNHHQIELGAVYGLNKTDDLFFYDADGKQTAGYHYSAIRVSLTYGYEIPASNFLYFTPMAGVSYLAYMGTEASGSAKGEDYKNANSLSAIMGVRMSMALGSQFRLFLSPEYHAAVYKDSTCKLVSSHEDNMKNWNTGFNLNAGLLIYF